VAYHNRRNAVTRSTPRIAATDETPLLGAVVAAVEAGFAALSALMESPSGLGMTGPA